jgi:hypothetical protein
VTVSSFHERPLGGGRSHTMAVGAVAARAQHAVTLRSLTARAAGDTVQPYTVSNDTATAVRLTAAPVSCMYDNGQDGSNASWVSNFTPSPWPPGARSRPTSRPTPTSRTT